MVSGFEVARSLKAQGKTSIVGRKTAEAEEVYDGKMGDRGVSQRAHQVFS